MAGVLQYALSLKTGEFDNPLRKSQSELSGFKGSAGGASSGIGSLAAAAGGATAVIAGFAAATKLALSNLEAYAEFDGLEKGLTTIEGSLTSAQMRMEKLRATAKAPGLGFEEAVRGDIRLRSVGISADLSERSMRAFGNALATVGGGKSDLDGVILALTQIESKGKVSAEEINQLSERVPQVRAAMKAAFGTADTEALGKTAITTTDFIGGLVSELEKLPIVTSGARNTLDNYNDSWKELKNTAASFGQEMATTWTNEVASAFRGATRLLNQLKDAMGTGSSVSKDPETRRMIEQAKTAREARAEKKRQDEEEVARKIASNAAAERGMEAMRVKMAAERAEGLKRLAEQQSAIDDKAKASLIASQEKVFAARLTQEQNLQRQIEAIRAEGPADVDSLNANKSLTAKAEIAERLARIVELEKQLKDLRSNEAAKDQAKSEAAKTKAAAAAKELSTQQEAAQIFNRENSILQARISGNDKLATQLERQAKVEALKKDLMERQGLSAKDAIAAAEKRVALEEKAAHPGRRGLLDAAASAVARAERRSTADKERDTRLGRDGAQADRLAIAAAARRVHPLNPAAAADALARGNAGADPGKVRREERAEANRKAADPLYRVVKSIEEKFSNLATA